MLSLPTLAANPAMYDHSARSIDDLLARSRQVQLIDRYERRHRYVVIFVDGYRVTLNLLQAHLFLCGMLWSTPLD